MLHDHNKTISDDSHPAIVEMQRIGRSIPRLIVLEGGNLRAQYEIDQSEMIIGRDADCALSIQDSKVSRNHAKIDCFNLDDASLETRVVLTDLGSTNGTFVNGQPVSQIELRDQDRISIGPVLFCFTTGEEDQLGDDLIIQPERRDTLTGLASRDFFNQEIQRRFDRARCYFRDLSMLILEIDNFKRLNDAYGHQVGYEVLRETGALVRQTIRQGDFAARYSVIQFSVILPETSMEEALVQAERLRNALSMHSIPTQETAIGITASVGVAMLVPSMRGAGELIEAADRALFRAIDSGRNQVCWHRGNPEPHSSGNMY